MEHLASMEHQEHLAKTASTDYLASQDLRVNLAHPVSLCHRTNPDLPARIKAGAVLNAVDPSTFYSAGPEGYTDYPALPA